MDLGDETALANWRKWRDLSIEKYKEEYGRLNIAFDVYSGESQVGLGGLATWSCAKLMSRWHLIHYELPLRNCKTWVWSQSLKAHNSLTWRSSSWARLLFKNKVGILVFYECTKSNQLLFLDGTSLYLTRDIAGAIERYEKYKFDKMIYVVASQQDLHCAQFIKTVELMGYPWAKSLEHVNFGT